MLLRLGHERAERLAQRREPLAVVHQFAEGHGELLLFVHGHLVEAERLEHAVRLVEDRAARRLIHAAALHADEPVLHNVQNADAVGAAELVELEDDVLGAHLLAVERDGLALLEVERDVGRGVRCVNRAHAQLEEARLLILRLVARILQIETLMAQVPEVLVLGVVGLAVDLQGHVVRLGVSDLLLTRLDVPLTPRGDDRHIGREVLDGQLKTHLIVALAGAAVGDGVRALLLGNLDEALGDARARMARAEQVLLVHGASLHGRDDVIVDVFVRQVEHVELRRAGLDGLFLQTVELVGLTDVAGHGDDFAVVVVLLQPRDDDGRIQTAGVSKDDFFDIFFFHNGCLH